MLKAYFFKLVHSPFLYAGIIGVFGLCLIHAKSNLWEGVDVLTDLRILLDVEGYRKAFIVFAALPFAANFSDEWNTKTTTNCVTRKCAFTYAVSNFTSCFISALVTVFIPLVVFVAVSALTAEKPFSISNGSVGPYNEFVEMGVPFLEIVFYYFTYSLSCAMWAVTGMTLSAFFPSKYIAIGSPFVLSYAIEQFTAQRLPIQLDLMGLSFSALPYSAGGIFFYTTFVFVGLSMLCGIIFTKKVEKRVQNELG